MEITFLWFGFIGAWLLFGGPIYQAALELSDEDFERDRIHRASHREKSKDKVSFWWWLLPPVKIILERRRLHRYRQQYLSSLEPAELERLISFINKATGWLLVALGGFLLAIKETYEFCSIYNYSNTTFWLIVWAATLICVINIVIMSARFDRMVEKYTTDANEQ